MLQRISISVAQTLMRSFDIDVIATSTDEAEKIALQMVKDGLARWSESGIMETVVDGYQCRGPCSLDAARARAQRLANEKRTKYSVWICRDKEGTFLGYDVDQYAHGDELKSWHRDICAPRGITRKQREALLRIYRRSTNPTQSYLAFRRTVSRPSYDTCVMIQWAGMWLGIETDGHTHS